MTYILIFICVALYSLFAVFLSRMGGRINANLGAAIFMAIGTIVPILYYGYERMMHKGAAVLMTGQGLMYAILAGVAIAAWNVIVIVIFSRGGNLAYVYPIIYGAGAILIPSLIGWLFFKELINPLQLVGLGLLFAGLVTIIISKTTLVS